MLQFLLPLLLYSHQYCCYYYYYHCHYSYRHDADAVIITSFLQLLLRLSCSLITLSTDSWHCPGGKAGHTPWDVVTQAEGPRPGQRDGTRSSDAFAPGARCWRILGSQGAAGDRSAPFHPKLTLLTLGRTGNCESSLGQHGAAPDSRRCSLSSPTHPFARGRGIRHIHRVLWVGVGLGF